MDQLLRDWWGTLTERQRWSVIGAGIILLVVGVFFVMGTYAFLGTDYAGVGDLLLRWRER